MMQRLGTWIALVLVGIMPSQTIAASSCWTSDQVRAAKVRDFYSMVMVGALRCRHEDPAIMAKYGTFLTKKATALSAANMTLRGHYTRAVGAAKSADEVDRYATKVANRYGAGVPGLECADIATLIQTAIQAPATAAALADFAASDPFLDAPRCDAVPAPLRVASLTTVRVQQPTSRAVAALDLRPSIPHLDLSLEAIAKAPTPLEPPVGPGFSIAVADTVLAPQQGGRFPR